jgi:deoxycytidylate deaminase
MKTKLQWLWIDFAQRVAILSPCTRLKVGCVITSLDGEEMFSFGYNGTYRGGPNECLRVEVGNCGCVHAEMNALSKRRTRDSFAVFLTHTPCERCAHLLINARVTSVYALEAYRNPDPWDLLSDTGISTRILSP